MSDFVFFKFFGEEFAEERDEPGWLRAVKVQGIMADIFYQFGCVGMIAVSVEIFVEIDQKIMISFLSVDGFVYG